MQLEKDAGFMDKYSRQIGAFGLETMAKVRSLICAFECGAARCVKRFRSCSAARFSHGHSVYWFPDGFCISSLCSHVRMYLQLVKLRVLIVGMQGVGIECAKNLILAGPGAITLHDGTINHSGVIVTLLVVV